MTLIDKILGREEQPEPTEIVKERLEGKIVKLDDGWGFIVSKDVPYTRIFFHWSGLNQDTLHFTKLEKGMWIEFELLEIPGKGLRAIKIKVLEEKDDEN